MENNKDRKIKGIFFVNDKDNSLKNAYCLVGYVRVGEIMALRLFGKDVYTKIGGLHCLFGYPVLGMKRQ